MSGAERRDQIERHIAGPSAPAALAAERALLGVILADQGAMDLVDGLSPAHFFEPLHRRIWAAIVGRHENGAYSDTTLLDDQFAGDNTYRDAGGIGWLANLIETAPGRSSVPAYVTSIKAAAQRRAVIRLGADMTDLANDPETEPESLITTIRARADDIEQDGAEADATLVPAPAVLARTVAAMQDMAANGRPRGLMTGLRCVDRRLNGLKPGSLVVIGGRPGMGKTGVARAIAHGAAARNPDRDFLFFGLEMGPDEMMQRELSALTYECEGVEPVEYRAMESGSLTPMDFMQIDAVRRYVPANLVFEDRAGAVSVDDVRRKVWAWNRRRRVGAVFIDYLQLMARPPSKGRNEASVIGDMTKALKQMARQAGVTVVLLSQLNRSVESRDDKRPQLSDLRESGSIEQDADAVLFPFREHYYLLKAEPPNKNGEKHLEWEMACQDTLRRLDVICAKQRGGPEGTDRQKYFAEYDYIEDDHDRA